MTDLKQLNTKAFIREVLGMNSANFVAAMKKLKEKYPERYSDYSETSKTVSNDTLKKMIKDLGSSQDEYLKRIQSIKGIFDIKEMIRIANWLDFELPDDIEKIRRNFGIYDLESARKDKK